VSVSRSAYASDELPKVTVVMAVRNEAKCIRHSLARVLDQDYPKERMEIIVADGLSTDGTREALAALQSAHKHLRVIDNPKRTVAPGLNRAIREATGDIIVRVDGHTEIAHDYVSECVGRLLTTGADNVGGNVTAVGQTRFGKAVALATSSRFGVGGARFHYAGEEQWVDTVYMGAWPRPVLDRIGLFDEELVRDQGDELNYRLLASGGRILLSPRIKSVYTGRSTPWSLWRQYYEYGFWKVRVMQKHPRQMRPRQFAPGILVASLVASVVLSTVRPFGRLLFAVISGSYILANLGASVSVARRYGLSHIPLLPVTYGILHFGYGLGFLAGLVRFARRWGKS